MSAERARQIVADAYAVLRQYFEDHRNVEQWFANPVVFDQLPRADVRDVYDSVAEFMRSMRTLFNQQHTLTMKILTRGCLHFVNDIIHLTDVMDPEDEVLIFHPAFLAVLRYAQTCLEAALTLFP